jgi:hypothetical protein
MPARGRRLMPARRRRLRPGRPPRRPGSAVRPGRRRAQPAGQLAVDDQGRAVADFEDPGDDVGDRRVGQRDHDLALADRRDRLGAGRRVEPAEDRVRAELGLEPMLLGGRPQPARAARRAGLDRAQLGPADRERRGRDLPAVQEPLEQDVDEVDLRRGIELVGQALGPQVEVAGDQAVPGEAGEVDEHRVPRRSDDTAIVRASLRTAERPEGQAGHGVGPRGRPGFGGDGYGRRASGPLTGVDPTGAPTRQPARPARGRPGAPTRQPARPARSRPGAPTRQPARPVRGVPGAPGPRALSSTRGRPARPGR